LNLLLQALAESILLNFEVISNLEVHPESLARRESRRAVSAQTALWPWTISLMGPGRSARSLPEGRSLALRERERTRDQVRGRNFQPRRSLRDRRLRELKTKALPSSGVVA